MTTPLDTLGRYTLIRRLASGGMGEVYLGRIEGAANFTRQVAIKRILPHLARDEAFVRKFIDEANVMVQLHHGNIVPVQELADEQGELFLVMEYLPGRDLKAVMKEAARQSTPFPIELALYVLAEVASGLDYAHRRTDNTGEPLGIVHRDVSPSNVLLGAAGEVKLTDFGVARARGGLHQSISGMLQGKFVYMSPEQADGQPVDARSDVFSAGLVLYELLTRRRPFEGQTDTETLRKVRTVDIAPPSASRPELGPEIDALVMTALTRPLDERYATAQAFQVAIRDELARRGSAVGGQALADFLKKLFPEGVVPTAAPDAPMSLDDALLAQLSGGTPSAQKSLGLTRTLTGDREGTLSAPAHPAPLVEAEGTLTPAVPQEQAEALARAEGDPISPQAPVNRRLVDPAPPVTEPTPVVSPMPPTEHTAERLTGGVPAAAATAEHTLDLPAPPGTRRRIAWLLAVGGLLGALLTVVWARFPREVTIPVEVLGQFDGQNEEVPLKRAAYWFDDVPGGDPRRDAPWKMVSGEEGRPCVDSEVFARDCQPLDAGAQARSGQPLRFVLQPKLAPVEFKAANPDAVNLEGATLSVVSKSGNVNLTALKWGRKRSLDATGDYTVTVKGPHLKTLSADFELIIKEPERWKLRDEPIYLALEPAEVPKPPPPEPPPPAGEPDAGPPDAEPSGKPQRAAFTIKVHTMPSGGTIFFDKKRIGPAPQRVKVPPHGGIVSARLPGHRPAQVKLNRKSRRDVTLTLDPLPRIPVRYRVVPGAATVWLDGQRLKAPAGELTTTPGRHTLKARLDALGEKSREFVVKEGGRQEAVVIDLTKTP